jgi:hypothetical protein
MNAFHHTLGGWVASILVAVSLAALMPRSASASPITVNNFSFESVDAGDGLTNAVSNWTYANAGVYDPQNAQFAGTTGDNVNSSARCRTKARSSSSRRTS